mmetsp:Transcript_41803/g.110466  ORF Transcript_41803/g.110466 Transcript_41803/m.110466 type:complete len:248 (+) Transcript_41803:406-1149(+)
MTSALKSDGTSRSSSRSGWSRCISWYTMTLALSGFPRSSRMRLITTKPWSRYHFVARSFRSRTLRRMSSASSGFSAATMLSKSLCPHPWWRSSRRTKICITCTQGMAGRRRCPGGTFGFFLSSLCTWNMTKPARTGLPLTSAAAVRMLRPWKHSSERSIMPTAWSSRHPFLSSTLSGHRSASCQSRRRSSLYKPSVKARCSPAKRSWSAMKSRMSSFSRGPMANMGASPLRRALPADGPMHSGRQPP